MREDPIGYWEAESPSGYQDENYGKSLAGNILRRSHSLLENTFSEKDFFPSVLEVGCGLGFHAQFVKHRFDSYLMTDAFPKMLVPAKQNNVADCFSFLPTPAESLPFADKSFDRVIASHVLEHLYRPHEVLREWDRVIKDGGVLSLILPCDPGFGWRLGRMFGPRKRGIKRGFPYDYMMAREHVNPINNLVSLIRYYFDDIQEKWWPFRVPVIDINLLYIVNINK